MKLRYLGANKIRFPVVGESIEIRHRTLKRPIKSFSVKPLDVGIVGANQPLSAGKRYELVCQTSGSRPPAGVTWRRNGQRLVDSKETVSVATRRHATFILATAIDYSRGPRLIKSGRS